MKYYKIAIKVNEVLLYTVMGRNLKKICNEISQIHKIVALTGSIYIKFKTNKQIYDIRSYTYGWFMVMFGRNQHNTVKQGASLVVAQLVKNFPAMQETLVQFLCLEDPLEKG